MEQEIFKQAIREWLDSSVPDFALLLDGPWGSGKTYFAQQLIQNKEIIGEGKPLYVSLFGISSSTALANTIFLAGASKKEKIAVGTANIFGSLFKAKIPIDIDGDGTTDGNISTNFKTLGGALQGLLTDLKNSLIVFDDLERATIPFEELAGYINQLVEHLGAKVIIIGNCAELENKENAEFTKFRDKVVGPKYSVPNDPGAALDTFIADLEVNHAATKEIIKRKQLILDHFEKSSCGNLRALKRFIFEWFKLVSKMEARFRTNEWLLNEFTYQLWIFVVEFDLKSSKEAKSLTTDQIQYSSYGRTKRHLKAIGRLQSAAEWSGTSGFNKPEKREDKPVDLILEKYKALRPWGNTAVIGLLDIPTYKKFLKDGTLSKEELNYQLSESEWKNQIKEVPSWRRLWHRFKTDYKTEDLETFDRDIQDLKSQLMDAPTNFPDPSEFVHAALVYLSLVDDGTVEAPFEVAFAEMKAQAEEVVSKIPEEQADDFYESSDWNRFGLGYAGSGTVWQNEFKEHMRLTFKARADELFIARKGQYILGKFRDQTDDFLGSLGLGNGNHRYYREAVLNEICPKEFVDVWTRHTVEKQYTVDDKFLPRYKTGFEMLAPEYDWWEKVTAEMQKRSQNPEVHRAIRGQWKQLHRRCVKISNHCQDLRKRLADQKGST